MATAPAGQQVLLLGDEEGTAVLGDVVLGLTPAVDVILRDKSPSSGQQPRMR